MQSQGFHISKLKYHSVGREKIVCECMSLPFRRVFFHTERTESLKLRREFFCSLVVKHSMTKFVRYNVS